MDRASKNALLAKADKYIRMAKNRADIDLKVKDFDVVDGELWLDGMDPKEWIDAQMME